MGYNGDVPKKNLYIKLQPLLHESWKSMDALDPGKQNLDQICDSLLEEGKLRKLRRQRRINPLKAKKGGGERHSDYMDKLDKLIIVAKLSRERGPTNGKGGNGTFSHQRPKDIRYKEKNKSGREFYLAYIKQWKELQ